MRRIDWFYDAIVGTSLVALLGALVVRDWRSGLLLIVSVGVLFILCDTKIGEVRE